jgi:LPPG:FO 2-phospho-L-lactate transferase
MKIVALAGGVGGAKLVSGLAHLLPQEDLTVVVNTGDDFEHLGLSISPDLDTICYTLAGLANAKTGWGRDAETFFVLDNLTLLGGPDWFKLGDRDLATHIERTRRLREGQLLSQITRDFCNSWGVQQSIIPMSNQPVHTMVDTWEEGELAFQEYFVHRKCEPKVKGFRFEGIATAQPAEGILAAIDQAEGIVICPSNPWVSIDPILAIKGIRTALGKKIVIAVSPIISGQTVKGPAAKMFTELDISPSAMAVAHHYRDLLTGFIFDRKDSSLTKMIPLPSKVTNTLMKNQDDRRSLAQDVLNLIQTL